MVTRKTTLARAFALSTALIGCEYSYSNETLADESTDGGAWVDSSSTGGASPAREGGAGGAKLAESSDPSPTCPVETTVPLCTPGSSAACTCTDGASGAQVCGADGKLAACVCAKPAETFPECVAMGSLAGFSACRNATNTVYPRLNCKTNPDPSKCTRVVVSKSEPDIGMFCCEL